MRSRTGHRATTGAFTALALVAGATLAVACDDNDIDLPWGPDATAPPGDPPPEDAGGEGEEAVAVDLFDRVNAERGERGLEPVEWDDRLADLASEWSREMADVGLQHRQLDQELFEDRLDGFDAVGENIFTATAAVPAGEAHLGWMQSDSHRANILGADWDRLGIGVYCAPDGQVFATQNFGRTARADPPAGIDDPPPPEPIARAAVDGPSC